MEIQPKPLFTVQSELISAQRDATAAITVVEPSTDVDVIVGAPSGEPAASESLWDNGALAEIVQDGSSQQELATDSAVIRSHPVPVLPATPASVDEKSMRPKSEDPWDDVARVQPKLKKEEPTDGPQNPGSSLAAATTELDLSIAKTENGDEFKPQPIVVEIDPWDDLSRVQPQPKEEEEVPHPKPQSGSLNLKRSYSVSSLSALSSDDVDSDSKVEVLPRKRNKRPRYSQTVSLPHRLVPVTFNAKGRPKVKSGRQPRIESGYALKAVIFNPDSDSGADLRMPPVGEGGFNDIDLQPLFGEQEMPPVFGDDDVSSRRSSPSSVPPPISVPPPASVRRGSPEVRIRVKDEPIDDDIIMLNTNRENLATDVKIKMKKDMQLDEVTIQSRLIKANATVPYEVDLDDVVRSVLVSRGFMSSFFGGSMQDTFPHVAKKRYDMPGRGLNDFMYVGLHLHPGAPKAPGEPGVWHLGVVCDYRDIREDRFQAPFMKKKIPPKKKSQSQAVKIEDGVKVENWKERVENWKERVENWERQVEDEDMEVEAGDVGVQDEGAKMADGRVKVGDEGAKSKPKRETKQEENAPPQPKQSKQAPSNTTDIFRVFVGGFEGKLGRKWLYMGQYRLIEVDDLTLQEWLLQDDKVKTAWSENLTKNGWGLSVSFRCKYRRMYQREPTVEEFEHWWGLIDAKLESPADWRVEPRVIRADMDAGKERLTVEVMKCVGYDADFQRQIARDVEDYVPPPRKAKKSKKDARIESDDDDKPELGQSTPKRVTKRAAGAKKTGAKKAGVKNDGVKKVSGTKATTKKPANKAKGRRPASPSPSKLVDSDVEQDDVEEDDADEDDEEADTEGDAIGDWVYKNRGTRSRPFVID